MNFKIRMILQALVLAGALIFVVGCNVTRIKTGPTQTESQVVELGAAQSVRANISMGVGQLNISGGAGELMDAEFIYNIAEWRPEVSYQVQGDVGQLTVSQPDASFDEGPQIPDNDVEYRWNLRLNDDAPMDLSIDLGVGEGNLQLGGLNLSSLNIETGVGKSVIDLGGKWRESLAVDISTGVGEVVLRLPGDVGVRVEANTGIGQVSNSGLQQNGDIYTNAAYESSPVTLNVKIDGGVGEVKLELAE